MEEVATITQLFFERFWWIVWFNIVMFFLAISGFFALVFGLLVTVPLTIISYAVAFQEIFGLNMKLLSKTRVPDMVKSSSLLL